MIITEEKTERKQPRFLDAKPIEFHSQPEIRIKTGLCTTCIHRTVCCLTCKQPVSECEEYISEENEEKIKSGKTPVSAAQSFPVHGEDGKYQGLCINCENRHSCPLSSTDGGVWYCEEYH